MINKKWFLIALFFGFFYLLILQLIAIWPFTIDDMYISLRYAKNWAEGGGLLWNLGEEPVEGYSNFSFVVIAALALRSGLDPVLVLKSLGAFSLLLSTLALYYLSRLWFSWRLAFIPCLWMLTYRGELIWAASGLETIFFQALIAFSLLFLLRGMGYCFYPTERQPPQLLFLVSAGFLLALAGTTRPETPALMLLFYGLALFDPPKKSPRAYYKALLLSVLSCLLFFLPYFFWRWHYYGQLLPNTVYCKGYSDFWAVLDKSYLYLIFPLIGLSLLALFRVESKLAYYFCLPSLIYLILLLNADPVSAFDNRLFLPAFVLLLPPSLWGLSKLVGYFFPQKDGFYTSCLVVCILGIALFFLQPLSLTNYRSFTQSPQSGILLRNKVLSWLENNVSANSKVVLGDSGQIPYLSSLSYIDSTCLNNKEMAKSMKNNKYQKFCEAIFVKKPEVLILAAGSYHQGKLSYLPVDACLHERLKEDKNYQIAYIGQSLRPESYYRYEIYTLRN